MVRVAMTEGRRVNVTNDRPVDFLLDIDGIREFFSARGRPMSKRQAYRLAESGWPIFKIGGRLTARGSALENKIICEEIRATARRRRLE